MMTCFKVRASLWLRVAALTLGVGLCFGCAEGSPGTLIGPPDATVGDDMPDVMFMPDGVTDDGQTSSRCTSNADCSASPAGTVCDTVTGTCAQCTAAQDMCPPGQFCDPTNDTCRAGCTSDTDCGSGGVTHCDMTSRRCVGCTVDGDCALGTLCMTGACVPGCSDSHGCGVGQSCCAGQCADLQSNAMNCGTCGTSCGKGGACCGGACLPVSGDAHNCGRCGNVCTAANGSPACTMGACIVGTCDTGFGDCDHAGPNGCEADLSTDAMNCGACGHPCVSGPNAMARCAMGRCVNECTAGFGDCDMNPTNGCETAVATDASNCGACGTVCPGGPSASGRCAMGSCGLSCVPGTGDCDMSATNGCEVTLTTSAMNCGSCGVVCSFPNGVASCSAGSCVLSTCAAGFDNCDGNAMNGCETPTATDNQNCGRCGTRCGTGTACSMGACNSLCTGGTTFCTASCVSLDSDASNCGSCGRACPTVPNSTPACRGGACGLSCNRGFGDCDGSASTGCETNLATATENCGTCANLCRAASASVACVDGTCRVAACNSGFANCNGSDADGCETNVSADVSNCGGCGRPCNLPHAGASCSGGGCSVSGCTPGFANCNGVDGDGCEVDTSNNNFNCGRCGLSCPPGTACSAGSCASICAGGTTFCSGSCVSLSADARNCGACGNVCAAGQSCVGGACRTPGPANDTCGGAQTISIGPTNQTIAVNNTGAATDLPIPSGCGFGGQDVWFRFTLSTREIVYADTVDTTFDTILYFASSCSSGLSGSPAPGMYLCNDDMGSAGCTGGGLQSQVAAIFNPGTYYLVFAGYGSSTGAATIHFQHLPAGNGAVNPLNAGVGAYSGVTSGTGTIAAPCPLGATGPENTWWWKSCPDSAGGGLSATTCSRASWDTVLYLRNADGVGDVCNDDSCGLQSTLSSTVGRGAGLHMLYVDGYGGSSGSYSVAVTRP